MDCISPFARKVGRYIAVKHLLSEENAYLVALSGGADSVALLCVLTELGYKVEAAHCNFGLRGAESDRDEAFCRDLCGKRGIPFHIARFDTPGYADLHSVSIEMAARELRYDYFLRLADDLSCGGVCVAHHKNDAVETLLLNLIRGTGIEGLKGIACRNGRVLRPLLCVTKQEITDYLSSAGQDYVTDSSNLVADVKRNKIRLKVVPLLEEINPAAGENISKTIRRVEDSLDILRDAVAAAQERVTVPSADGLRISIPLLMKEKSAGTVLWELLKDKGFSSAQTERIFHSLAAGVQTGKEWASPSHLLLIDRGEIIVEAAGHEVPRAVTVPEQGIYLYGADSRFSFDVLPVDEGFSVLKSADGVSLDAGRIRFPLTIRAAASGDRFVPFGMTGSKLLSDFLTDKKVPLPDKRRQTVVADASGRILWVVGFRADNRFRISVGTRHALIIRKMLIPRERR